MQQIPHHAGLADADRAEIGAGALGAQERRRRAGVIGDLGRPSIGRVDEERPHQLGMAVATALGQIERAAARHCGIGARRGTRGRRVEVKGRA